MSLRVRMLLAALLLIVLPVCACASMPELHGYDKNEQEYIYVTFGRYPTGKNGEVEPVIWRILGTGMPGEGDIINQSNLPPKGYKKIPNVDTISEENADVYCLMTQSIIDVLLYHPTRDEQDGPALDYVDSLIYDTLNTDVISTLFTAEEQAVLVPMPERGLLGLPSRKGELYALEYGFANEDFCKSVRRSARGTPYAYAKGLKRVAGNSWYWTTDWRAPGRRWIVGDDGHISVSGVNREGGVRPICYVHMNRLTCSGGTGTLENPYVLSAP